jgi:hypothetical protein
VDKWLLKQSLIEIKHVLQTACIKLFESDNSQNISVVQLFLVALPYQFLNIFSKWLKAVSKTGTPNPTQPLFTFGNICVFVFCKCKLKILGISESLLEQFGISSNEAKQYKVIHEAMTKADKPASHCKVIQRGA